MSLVARVVGGVLVLGLIIDVPVITDTITVATVTHSDVLDQPIYDGSLFEGSGDQVLRVNEIGPFESTVRLGNPLALEITADGQWTLVSQ